MRISPTLELESLLIRGGIEFIAGVDEAGRGPVAGPVTAAAVILPVRELMEKLDRANGTSDGESPMTLVRDSKELSERQRELALSAITEIAVDFSVAHVPNETIDAMNILNATRLAVTRAIEALSRKPSAILIDGKFLNLKDRTCISIVKGDSTIFSIAAASIIAKTARDALMRKYADEYPLYSFEKNKGYLTERHLEAIRSYGLSNIHRKSFTIPV
ncbi:MAG: ribonuclease HII [Bacteroidetes bacterium]|jgi:ribonuclease HII|nr:ribonuclease HII [Bacteroidota bacterium]